MIDHLTQWLDKPATYGGVLALAFGMWIGYCISKAIDILIGIRP